MDDDDTEHISRQGYSRFSRSIRVSSLQEYGTKYHAVRSRSCAVATCVESGEVPLSIHWFAGDVESFSFDWGELGFV